MNEFYNFLFLKHRKSRYIVTNHMNTEIWAFLDISKECFAFKDSKMDYSSLFDSIHSKYGTEQYEELENFCCP